jgi:hypothetical protein
MSKTARREVEEDEASLDDVVDLGSIPPPADVHAARTAVAELPPELLDQLRSGAVDARTRKLPRFEPASFMNEAPTAPGRDGLSLLRPLAPALDDNPPPMPSDDLVSSLTAALAEAEAIPKPSTPPTTYGAAPMREPEIVRVTPMPIAIATAPPMRPQALPPPRSSRSEMLLGAAVVVVACAAAAAAIVRTFHLLH